MELRHLRAFLTVANQRNFSRAAELLNIAQPALSRQIRELEYELRVTLFDRSTRPIRLTEHGRMAYEQAVQIIAGVDQLHRSMVKLGASQQDRFVVGVVSSIMLGDLPALIRDFRKQVPDVEVELVELTTVEQVIALKSGRIDVGLGRVRIDDPAIRREVIHLEPLIAALPNRHDGANASPPPETSIRALDALTLIVYPNQPRPSYADQVLGLLRDHACVPQRILEVREVQTALGMVASESGYSLVPSSMQHIHRPDIAYARLTEKLVSPIILSRRAGDINDLVRLFNETATAIFAEKQELALL